AKLMASLSTALRRDGLCGSCYPGKSLEERMDQRIINLYDRFTHGGMSRRDFLDRLSELAGSAAAAAALLPLLRSNYGQAAIVPAADARLGTRAPPDRGAQGQVD